MKGFETDSYAFPGLLKKTFAATPPFLIRVNQPGSVLTHGLLTKSGGEAAKMMGCVTDKRRRLSQNSFKLPPPSGGG